MRKVINSAVSFYTWVFTLGMEKFRVREQFYVFRDRAHDSKGESPCQQLNKTRSMK